MGDDAELTFVARLRDEASAAAARLKRTLGGLSAPIRGVNVPVDVDGGRAISQLAAVNARLEGLERVSRSAGRGLLAIGRYGAIGLGVLGGLAGVGLAAGLKTAAGMENADIAFTTMLGSAGKAQKLLGELRNFAATTPFEFPELQTAASSLISAGINANKVIPIMTTLGNVTSGMGTGAEGVQRATIALQQMSAAGRITGEDLNQLRDAGVPVFDLLAAATGKSKAEVAGLAQAGKLGSKELGQLMKALESGKGLERFSGLMEKQSASLSGQFSTLKDNANMALAGMVEPILPLLKRGMATVSETIASAGDKVPELVGKVRSSIAIIKTFGGGSENAAKSLGRLFGVNPSKIRAIQGIVTDLADVFRNSFVPALRDASGVLPAFLAPLGLARVALGFLADHETTARVALAALMAGILVVVPAMRVLSAITTTTAAAKAAYALATGRGATAEQAATRAKIASTAASARLRAMYAVDALKGAISATASYVTALARQAAATAVATAARARDAAVTAGTWVAAQATAAASSVRATAALARQAAATVAQRAVTIAVSAATKAAAAAQWLLNAAMTANPIGLVIAAIALLVAGFILAYRKSETFRDVVKGALHAVQVGAGEAVGFMIDGFRRLLSIWLTVADGIISGAAKALGWIPGLGGKLKRANAAFDKMRAGIDSTLAGLADSARGWGDDVATGLAGGISASSYKAIAAAGGMAAKVNQVAKDTFATSSPSKVFAQIGRWLPEGLAKGIREGGPAAVAAMKALTERIVQLVKDKRISKVAGDAIVAKMKAQNDDLRKLAVSRAGLVTKLEAARDRLKSVLDSSEQLRSSTADAARGFGSLAGLGPDTGAIDAATAVRDAAASELDRLTGDESSSTDDLANARIRLAAASEQLELVQAREAMTGENLARKLEERKVQLANFAATIDTLRARGLNESSIQELIASGAEAGSAAAAALAASSDATLAQINATAGQITAQADALGASTAAAMYGVGIKSAQGMVDGLVADIAAIDRAGRRLARRLMRAIRRELGIHSPSKVAERDFSQVPAGAVRALLGGVRPVEGAAAKLAASAARAASAELGGSIVPALPAVAIRATTGETITIRHEVTSPDGSVSELDARTIADMIASDARSAKVLEGAVSTAGNRRASYTIEPSA